MNFIEVKIIDKDTIELIQDARSGDRIDLSNITSVDLSFINEQINKAKEDEINRRVQERLDDKIKTIRAEEENRASKRCETYQEKLNKSDADLLSLKKDYEHLKENQENEIKLKVAEEKEKLNENVNNLQKEITKLQEQIKAQDEKMIEERKTLGLEKEKELEKQKNELTTTFAEKERGYVNQINNLQRSKAEMNVKNIGEDLEVWCDREIENYMQNGFTNCTWEKDNTVVREEGENKGSKADFIFKIYEDEKKEMLLTSVCLEMKDENPDSQNKKSNKDYYGQLDKNRNKKNCEYALLVSNLESGKPNEPLIMKVPDYQNMYMVRPAYMMTFLNMIVSLHTKFRKLIEDSKEETEQIRQYGELKDEFDKLKSTYLEKPIESLNKQIDEIIKQNENIIKANSSITQAANKLSDIIHNIQTKYIDEISKKLDKFDLGIQRAYKRLPDEKTDI